MAGTSTDLWLQEMSEMQSCGQENVWLLSHAMCLRFSLVLLVSGAFCLLLIIRNRLEVLTGLHSCQRPVARCDGSCAEYSDEEEGYNEDGGMIEEGEIDEDGADLVPNSGAAEGLASLTTATGPPPRPDGTETRTASTFAAVLARSQTPTGSAAAPFLLDT